MQRKRENGGEEERDGQHVGRVVVEVQVLVATFDTQSRWLKIPYGKAVPPGAKQYRAHDDERHIRGNRDAVRAGT